MPLAPATVGGRQHALAIVIFRTGDDMEPVVERMQADGAAEFVAFAVAAAGDAALDLALDPAEILVENEVDHTGHRVRTVGRRGAASDQVDTLDQLLRQHVRSEEHTSELQSLMRISY